MTLDDLLQDIYTLEAEMRAYERKYGVLSETFYASYSQGEEPPDESWVRDWTAWASAYQLWLCRRKQYQAAIDSQPHPDDPTLASTDPHHRHIPPDIKHHRIPASGLSFTGRLRIS